MEKIIELAIIIIKLNNKKNMCDLNVNKHMTKYKI